MEISKDVISKLEHHVDNLSKINSRIMLIADVIEDHGENHCDDTVASRLGGLISEMVEDVFNNISKIRFTLSDLKGTEK